MNNKPTTYYTKNMATNNTGQLNQWVTWPYALHALAKARSLNLELYTHAKDFNLAFLPNGSPITLDEFLEIVINKYGSLDRDFSVYKDMDFGGGDQKKLSSGKKTITDFAGPVYLLTAGTNDTRIAASLAITASAKKEPTFKGKMPVYLALASQCETLFTGLSVLCDIRQSKLPTLLLPVGSTDAHLILVDSDGKMEMTSQLAWSHSPRGMIEKLTTLLGTHHIKRVILAGSYLFGLDYEKYLKNMNIPRSDLDIKKNVFKQISPLTGSIMKDQVSTSAGDGNYDFSVLANSAEKGKDLSLFLNTIFNSDVGKAMFPAIELIGYPRKMPKELALPDIMTILSGVVEFISQ